MLIPIQNTTHKNYYKKKNYLKVNKKIVYPTCNSSTTLQKLWYSCIIKIKIKLIPD